MQVAVLGTGTMGSGFAHRLVQQGFAVHAWNRTRAKAEPLAAEGVVVAGTAREAVEDADVVITMLFDADAVTEVIEEAAPGVGEGSVWLQMSTVGLDGIGRLEQLASTRGLAMLDAPVLGTRKPAAEGTIVVLAAGDPALRDRVRPVLDALASRTVWVGEKIGAASALKLVCNAWIGTLTAGIAQSIALAQAFGLDGAQFLDAISGGQMDTPYAHIKGAEMLDDDFPTSFALDGLLKDLNLTIAAASADDLVPAVTLGVRDVYARASEAGLGREDVAAVFRVLRAG